MLREHLKLTGTKFGCGIAACGACTVHIDGEAMRSCAMPVSLVEGKSVTTIEGFRPTAAIRCRRPGSPSRCRNAATASPARSCRRRRCSPRNKKPTRDEIVEHMDGNICRCGTYLKIISAIQRAAREG